MASIKESIEVDVPIQTAYNQWTQFEEFPRFMKGVESVRQVDDAHLRWAAEIGGKRHEWDAEITHQEPDRRIAWRSTDGKVSSGDVSFEAIDGSRTRVAVDMSYDPEGLLETLGSAVGADDVRVKVDLERFKDLIEGRGEATGAWRGKIRGGAGHT